MPPAGAAGPVRDKPPPLWLVQRVINPVMRRLLPSRLGRWLTGMALLHFRGRKSGRAYVVPAGIYSHDGAQVVFTNSAWRLNFRGGTTLGLDWQGCHTQAYAELVTDPVYVGAAIRSCLAGGTSLTMLGIAIDKGHEPTDAELSAVRDAVVIRATPPG